MKIKSFKNKYDKKVKKNFWHKKGDLSWIIKIIIISFIISFGFSLTTEIVIPHLGVYASFVVVLAFIFIGILFDMIGIAVTVADKKTFNSMATKKVKGSKACLALIKNASKVSSFCNDVIGDICGILSGSAGAGIAISLANTYNYSLLLTTLLMTSIISALTIGGKALGKSYAMNKSNQILFRFAKTIMFFYKKIDR